jgi:hypothetical protein
MNCKIKEADGKLLVTATIGAARKGAAPSHISTDDILKWLSQNYPKHKKLNLVQEGAAHNAALKAQRTGTWIFSLAPKKAQNPPKTTKTSPSKSKKPTN